MGCPVPKVLKTGAGAALLRDPERAVAVARAAIEGSGLPVTVKLRSGLEPGDRSGLRARAAAGRRRRGRRGHAPPAARAASTTRGAPDYALVARARRRARADGTAFR